MKIVIVNFPQKTLSTPSVHGKCTQTWKYRFEFIAYKG